MRRAKWTVPIFLQAEDVMRDVAVTGVQTCALPILTPGNGIAVQYRPSAGAAVVHVLSGVGGPAPVYLQAARAGNVFTTYTSNDGLSWTVLPGRSEERRVGKERRSRWSPYH